MARCPYLEYESRGALFSQGDYYCDLCKKLCQNQKLIINVKPIAAMIIKIAPYIKADKRRYHFEQYC